MLKFSRSAFRHGLTRTQIKEALADPYKLFEELPDDAEGYAQDMAIGKTTAEVILEIALKYLEDDEIVFHANVATAARKIAYNRRSRLDV